MLDGRLVELATGEGKTLAAGLAAATAALAGVPVHVVTSNDYLAERDAAALAPFYQALGLSVAPVLSRQPMSERQEGYRCDVVYTTAKQLIFDYLRDRALLGQRPGKARLHLDCLAPGPGAQGLLLHGLCYAIVDEADSILIDEARTPFILSRPGEVEPAAVYHRALALAAELGEGYRVDATRKEVDFTPTGERRLKALAAGLTAEGVGQRRAEALIRQGVKARALFQRGRDYILRSGKIAIVDANTGRVMPGRAWEGGLQQLLEAKEGCALTTARVPIARLTYQRFFRRYLNLAGMTGTACEVSREIRRVYGLRVQRIAPRLPVRRRDLGVRVHATAEAKWDAITERVSRLIAEGRPVLVGTRTVAASEHLSAHLARAGIEHNVLSATRDADEAAKIARAGNPGRVTVATNMAGRGTDIRLAPGVAGRGGLHVIIAELNDSARIDRQLAGRCARQGEPGSFETILALADEPALVAAPALLRALACASAGGRRHDLAARLLARWGQRAVEHHHRQLRRTLLQLSERNDLQLGFCGPSE